MYKHLFFFSVILFTWQLECVVVKFGIWESLQAPVWLGLQLKNHCFFLIMSLFEIKRAKKIQTLCSLIMDNVKWFEKHVQVSERVTYQQSSLVVFLSLSRLRLCAKTLLHISHLYMLNFVCVPFQFRLVVKGFVAILTNTFFCILLRFFVQYLSIAKDFLHVVYSIISSNPMSPKSSLYYSAFCFQSCLIYKSYVLIKYQHNNWH